MIEAAEELGKSAGVSRACQILGVPRSRLYRARQPKRPPAPRPTPERALSLEEKAEVHQTLNCERFWDCSPLHQAGTAGHGAQSGLELGYHEAQGAFHVGLLLPVRHPGHL